MIAIGAFSCKFGCPTSVTSNVNNNAVCIILFCISHCELTKNSYVIEIGFVVLINK